MRNLIHRIEAHFAAHRQRPRRPFFWRITLEGIVVSLIAVVVLDALHEEQGGRPHLQELSLWKLVAFACFWAPLAETALLQTLPVMIARACGARFWMQILSSVIPFAALHFIEGVGVGVGAGVIGGFYFAFTYVHWREASLATAFAMTAGTHAVRNAFAIAAMLTVKSQILSA